MIKRAIDSGTQIEGGAALKAYVITTGVVFGLLTVVHIWRMIVEPNLATDPWFILATLVSGALCFGAWRVTRRQHQP